MRKTLIWTTLGLGYLGLAFWGSQAATGGDDFDRLSDADRKAFQQRFVKEIWPLLTRGGKDSCVGCHGTGKLVTALRLKGDAEKDFVWMLKEGFFLHGDRGSLLGRVTDKSAERRMPLKLPAWEEKDIAVLRQFSADLDARQKKR